MKIVVFVAISCILQVTGAIPVFDVSLDYFSGKPNPKWKLDQSNPKYTEINRLYTTAEKDKQLFTLINMPSVLGYRGFVLSDERGTDVLVVGQKTVQLQKLLLESAPRGTFSNILLGKLTKAIENGPEPVLAPLRGRRAVNYQPDDWKDIKVLKCNNCYNYGTDRFSKYHRDRAFPGLGGGQVYTDPITRNDVRDAAVRDRLIVTAAPVGGGIPVIPVNLQPARHLVALVVAEESAPGADDDDFHWYRLDSNNQGRWSHKPGSSQVTVRDGNNNYIVDPRNAANDPLGPNYVFVTFMTVIKNIVTVQGEQNNKC